MTARIFQGGFATAPILQVVQGTSDTALGTSSTGFVATHLTVSITPKFTTSLILVIAHSSAASFNFDSYITIFRGAVNLFDASQGGILISTESAQLSGSTIATPKTMQIFDSPGVVSSVTYTVYGRTTNGSGVLSYGGATQVITAIEFAQ